MTTTLDHQLDRIITIGASRDVVFGYFTDAAKWAAWWGAGSSIDPRPGGRVLVVHPGGVEASGEVLDVRAPEQIVFSYGYATGKPFPPGASRVTIRLAPHADGTQLHLTHEFAEPDGRQEHVQGWRYQLALFANLVANDVNREAAALVDAWFTAWNADEESTRRETLRRIAADDVRFADRFSCTSGQDDLAAHVEAGFRKFMPGLNMQRHGNVRHCQGHALADWVVTGADGQQKGSGTNLFVFDAAGRIASVTGFWG